MSDSVNVAVVQMVSGSDVENNMTRAFSLIKQAHEKGAHLVLLPENFAVFNAKALYEWGEKSHELTDQLAQWASQLGLWIVAGSLPQRNRFPETLQPVSDRRIRTSSLLFAPNGQLEARYDKIHLFDVDVADAHGSYRESETIEPGTLPVVYSWSVNRGPQLKLGFSICYDVRFPELYRDLRQQGADILFVPAAFTWKTGQAHWEPLLRARAIENQCYVLAANQGGQHTETRQTWGHSMIIDPWGDVLACHEEGEAVIVAEINRNRLQELRSQMPIQSHRVLSAHASQP
ncbi:MAG: carbon-nitrogen hydrolase family protein [Pseudomonadales bacterium]|nr:carbon-nitrogen hydrolase family protein [Pseudomonadales bacterium]